MDDSKLRQALQSELQCEFDLSPQSKALYATDASNYRSIPIGVIWPRNDEDTMKAVEICHSLDIPLLSRGGGTGLAGQTTNRALILDHSRAHNQILSIDPVAQTALVQPGVVLDDLRREAEKHQLTFGPDPATHNRCTLGGMLGNDSCGVHSVMAGKTVDNVISLDVLTYDGLRMTVGPTSREELAQIIKAGGRKSEIYSGMSRIAHHYGDQIRQRFPKIPRRVSGYNLNDLLPENHFNVARALVGTEGTCVTILAAQLRLVKSPQHRALIIVGFDEMYSAGLACPEIMQHHPIGLEYIDSMVIENMRIKKLLPQDIALMPDGDAWLLVEVGADSEEEKKQKAREISERLSTLSGFKDQKIVFDRDQQGHFWKVREASLGASVFVPGKPDAFPGWEDSAVPPEKIGEYVRDLKNLFHKYNYHPSIYGHFGQGCVHCRVDFDLITKDGIETYRRFTDEAADLVLSFGGSLSGEHGDGQARADLLPKMFGNELVQAFGEFKSLWDPGNKMNPGRMVHPASRTDNLRFGTTYAPHDPPTYFHYPEDRGSFARSTTRCVGVGLCRRENEGVMCPSYMATREEKHSTRGRAHLLYEMLQGQVIQDGWNSEEVKEALDLCLACKGCKGECPVNVDMATYKAEFLAHYFKKHWRPREAHFMGQIRRWAHWASHFPSLANALLKAPVLRNFAKWLAGIHPRRSLPSFAAQSFHRMYRKAPVENSSSSSRRVLLWVDTFNNYFHPEVAEAARQVLQKAGCELILTPANLCCGRPLYDFGFLSEAQHRLREILDSLREEIRNGTHFIFLEPSCCSVFKEEMPNFFPNDPDAFRLQHQCLMLSEYLIKKVPDFPWPVLSRKALVQGHCHHKSVLDMTSEEIALEKMGLKAEILDSGCCGMAGAFGFSEKHYEVSQACGERVLFRRVRESPESDLIIANGFSCREQIRQATGREVKHFAEVLNQALKHFASF